MDIRTFIDTHFNGNASAAARALGVTPGAVAQWKTNGVSPLREAQIKLWLLEKTSPDAAKASPDSPTERAASLPSN